MDNNLKYCPVCGNENPVDAVFCGHCGYDFSTTGSDQYQNTQYRDNEYNQQGYNSFQQQDQYNNQYNQNQYYNQYGYNTYNKQPKNSNGAKIAIIIVSIVLAVAVAAAGIYFLVFYDKDGDKNSNNGSVSAASSAKPIATTMPASTPNATPTPSPSPSPSPTPTPLPAANGGYVLPESSIRVVTKSDLIGLTPEQLMIARNEIYARHGRQFKTEWLQAHFNACPWYIINPNYNYNNEDSMLSSLELQNAKFILDYENGKI